MPTVKPDPMLIRSEVKMPSSREWPWRRQAMLSVVSLPTLVRLRSMIAQPSSNTRRPIRTPSSRQNVALNGVPSKIRMKAIDGTFQ